MKLVKIVAVACTLALLSGCATLFYEKRPTLQEAPLACGIDILLGFTIVPLAVDTLYGSCRMGGLSR